MAYRDHERDAPGNRRERLGGNRGKSPRTRNLLSAQAYLFRFIRRLVGLPTYTAPPAGRRAARTFGRGVQTNACESGSDTNSRERANDRSPAAAAANDEGTLHLYCILVRVTLNRKWMSELIPLSTVMRATMKIVVE